jgi:hypothetical protein
LGLKLNGTRQLLGYADAVNLLKYNVDTLKKKRETVIDNNGVGLEVNAKETKYMLLSQTRAQGKMVTKTANRSFENVWLSSELANGRQ